MTALMGLISKYRNILRERRAEIEASRKLADITPDEYQEPTSHERFKLMDLEDNRHGLKYQLAIHVHSSIFESENFAALDQSEQLAKTILVTDSMEEYRDYFIGGYVSDNINAILVIQAKDLNMLTLAKLAFS